MTLHGRPFPLVIAAPSGAGKTTLAHALVQRHPDEVMFSISATTRKRRERERPGKDYYFVDDAEFDEMIDSGELIEWATVHGCRYGTPSRGVRDGIACGKVVVLDIDVQGARQIRRAFADAVLVFILPPSAAELNRRLTGRGSEADADRLRRLRGARAELDAAKEFDYVVVNKDFEAAVQTLESILTTERHRADRMAELDSELRRLDAELAMILERGE
jgi:guanylate kinase